MKKIISILSSALIAIVLLIACKDDFLNPAPQDRISSEATWNDFGLAQAYIFNVYSFLGYGGFEEEMLASLTDEAMFTHTGRGFEVFTEGNEAADNIGKMSDTYRWGPMFRAIRSANLAIENLPEGTIDDEQKEWLLGEAHFLRAYYYHQLLRFYGGVPVIDFTYGLNEDYLKARNTFAETVDFIVGDLDKAAELLEGKAVIAGRASVLSALALKARVLIYAASDLHDGPTATANSSVLSGYPHLELVAYTSGSQETRWATAKTAAKAALDMGTGYKLNLAAPVSPEAGRDNYIALAMGGGSSVADASAAVELIFQKTQTPLYTPETQWPLGGLHFGINNGPNGYTNWGGNTPIQQLVDDYEMMDGSQFDWDDPNHAANPYENRDPRFYASILYDGADWKPRPGLNQQYDAVNQIQTGYYDNGSGGFINGVDTREAVNDSWNGSRTHYYVRKFIDPNPELPDNQSNTQVIPWPYIRYTEVVLNYVETCLETNEEEEARLWLNRIRFRAGMPEITETGDELWERYVNERRIELAYEEHRYHDARRWMIAPSTLGRGIKVINIRATLKPGQSPHVPYRYDPDVYDYAYTVVDNTEIEVRTWHDKMYYRPIERDELLRNSLLKEQQNPGYPAIAE